MSLITADAITTVGEVLQLAALLDHRIPTPDPQKIRAWTEQASRHRLEREDMLVAVQDFYDRPSSQPINVGDVIGGARRIKRDRLDREADTEREQRLDANSRKAELELFASAAPSEPVKKTDRIVQAEAALQTCTDRASAMAAMREYFDAKAEARAR